MERAATAATNSRPKIAPALAGGGALAQPERRAW
jgi:hypothetical protein